MLFKDIHDPLPELLQCSHTKPSSHSEQGSSCLAKPACPTLPCEIPAPNSIFPNVDHPPHRLLLPPAGRHHGRPQLDVREEGELLCEGHQILLYFLGRSYESEIILSTEVKVAGGGASSPGPVRVGEECYLVERSPDITGTASGGDR